MYYVEDIWQWVVSVCPGLNEDKMVTIYLEQYQRPGYSQLVTHYDVKLYLI